MSSEKITSQMVAAFLEERARNRPFNEAPIFYGDLAAHFELPPVSEAWQTHPLCEIFDELDVDDAKKSRPFRTVLVVSKAHSIPGPGFYKTVARLRPQGNRIRTEPEKMQFFSDEMTRLLKYYGNTAYH